tara:strand:+ start:7414 stop:8655 length:1242 start_codon:yes stop_codon:yes gene_type:complete
MANRNARPRKFYASPVTGLFDKALFAIAFVGGCAAILGMKSLGFSQWFASGIAVAIMCGYVGLTWASQRARIREDVIGDNVYYLGFLFTLISLGYALYDFGSGITESTIENVIANFGVALLSTIFGVFLRVFVSQFRADPVETEREARVELTEASNLVRAELSLMLADIGDFRREILQVMRESLEETAKNTQEALIGNAGRVTEVTEQLLARVDTASSDYAENTKRINAMSKRTAESLETLIKRIEDIEAPTDLITSRVIPVVDQISDITEELQRHAKSESGYADAISNTLSQIHKTIPELASKLEHAAYISENLSGLNKQITNLQSHLGHISETQMKQAGTLDTSAIEFTRAIREHTENMIAQHSLFEDTVSKFSSSIKGELEKVTEAVETSPILQEVEHPQSDARNAATRD